MLSNLNGRRCTHGLTIGLLPLLEAELPLLLVSGGHKRDALRHTMREPSTPMVPASLLRSSKCAVCVCDEAALG